MKSFLLNPLQITSVATASQEEGFHYVPQINTDL